jgi:translation initiation factor IF-3
LDLVEIVPTINPPVCKIIDFGKYKYEQQKKKKLQKKHQIVVHLKEVRFHPNTDVHDFEFKARHVREFLIEGHKVKAVVVFKGREIAYREFGENIMNRLTEKVNDVAKIDQALHMEGRNMIVIYTPEKAKKKIEHKTEDATEHKTESKIEHKTESKTTKIEKQKEGNKENAQDEK